jgi:hypothetical protein
MNANARRCVRWLLVALLAPCAMAQTPEQDRQREYYRELDRQREEQQRRAQEEMQRQQRSAEDASKRQQQLNDETTRNIEDHRKRQTPAAPAGNSAGTGSDYRALGKEMLRLPPLPAERNVLLGSWRLEGGGQQNKVLEFGLTGKGAAPGMGELMGFMNSLGSGQMICDMSFGRGMTFTPTTFSSGGAAGIAGGPVAYRSRNKQVIVAIPGDSRANPMPFTIAGPNRIVWADTCALVRIGAPAAHAAVNATTAPGPARAGVSSPSAAPRAAAMPQEAAAAVVVDGAGFRCGDGGLYHVTGCRGDGTEAVCQVSELHRPDAKGWAPKTNQHPAAIAARMRSCEVGGFRFDGRKPIFVR